VNDWAANRNDVRKTKSRGIEGGVLDLLHSSLSRSKAEEYTTSGSCIPSDVCTAGIQPHDIRKVSFR
jgi:hypothetical protein